MWVLCHLRDSDDALLVNWCEITTRTEEGKILYRNAFATSLAIDDVNVATVVASGRARWKIENENNNTLKTKAITSSTTSVMVNSSCLL